MFGFFLEQLLVPGKSRPSVKGWVINLENKILSRGRIYSHVRPFHERAVSDLDRSMHRSLWA
jgi:hypothetical protein